MKVWITKYALTSGVIEDEAETYSETKENIIVVKQKSGYTTYVHKPDWHDNETGAKLRVSDMIDNQIVSLEKKLARSRKLKTEILNKGLNAVMKKGVSM